ITNENDGAVSNVGVRALAEELEPKAQERTDQVFPASDGFGHDLIDPEGEDAQYLPEIYPVLGPLLGIPDLTYP
ncbi:MAG: hypothetical protein WBG36_09725, partial [Ornithinimicrobium sp.]